MKKIVLICTLFFAFFQSASAQFPTRDSLRTYINKWIRNSAIDAFTNLRLNTALNGVVTFLDSSGAGGSSNNTSVGSGFRVAINGTRNIKSLTKGYGILIDTATSNQVNFKVDSATLFSARRKVDTLYSIDDTTLRLTINGTPRDVIVKGAGGTGGSGTPGGSNTQIQYNNSSAFAGDAGLTYNATTNTVTTDSAVAIKLRIRKPTTTASSLIFSPYYSNSRPNAGIWLDETISNGDTNSVITLGHNWDASKANDGIIRIGLEQKYPPFPGATYRWKEAHLPEIKLTTGVTYRPASWEGRDDIKSGTWTYRADAYNWLNASDTTMLAVNMSDLVFNHSNDGNFRIVNRTSPANYISVVADKDNSQASFVTTFTNGFRFNTKINANGAITNTNSYGSSIALGNTVIESGADPVLKFAPGNATTYGIGIKANTNYFALGLNSSQVFGKTTGEGASILFDARGITAPIRFETVSSGGTYYYAGMGNNGKWQFGTAAASPAVGAYFDYTDAVRVASGTTAQRPTGAAAYLRYNSDSTALEYHDGTAWKKIATGTVNNITVTEDTYLPTSSNNTNVNTLTLVTSYYSRVANTVTVYGYLNVQPTATGAMSFEITLPVATGATSRAALSGAAVSRGTQQAMAIQLSSGKAKFLADMGITTSQEYAFNFTYYVQ